MGSEANEAVIFWDATNHNGILYFCLLSFGFNTELNLELLRGRFTSYFKWGVIYGSGIALTYTINCALAFIVNLIHSPYPSS